MADRKVYSALTFAECEDMVRENLPTVVWEEMTPGEVVVYAEIASLHRRIDEIENQASEMMGPEKMMEIAQGLFGSGLSG